MTPVFQSPERQAALRAEARSWLGTPFVPRANFKGVGVDCVHLPAEIYRALGVLPAYAFPALGSESSFILKAYNQRGQFRSLACAQLTVTKV